MAINSKGFLKPAVAGLALCGLLAAGIAAPLASTPAPAQAEQEVQASVNGTPRFLDPGTRVANPATDQFGVPLPEVLIKEDGTLIQRTPNFPTSVALKDGYGGEVAVGASGNLLGWTDPDVSIKYQDADGRGCVSCHEDLGEATNSISGTFAHPLLKSGLDVDITVSTCDHCHHMENRTGSFIHNIHKSFTDCFDCHELGPNDNSWQLFDEVKYDMLEGITKVDAADAPITVTYTQDKVIPTEQLFNIGWNDCAQSEMFNIDTAAGKTTPLDEELFDEWTFTVYGEGVENEMTWTLPELIEQAPSVTTQMTSICVDERSLGLVGNVEVTGIPLDWVLEQAGLKEDAMGLTPLSVDSGPDDAPAGSSLNIDDTNIGIHFQDRQVLLVYEINGERLSMADGYPLAFWSGADKASRNKKQLTAVRVDLEPHATFTNPLGKNGNYADMAVVGLEPGTCIQAGEPYTIEGYAMGFARPLEKLQFSLDNGSTWVDVDVSDTTADKWIWWTLEFTPTADVTTSYVLQMRAVAKDGSVTGFEPDGTELVAPIRTMVNAKADLEEFRAEVESR